MDRFEFARDLDAYISQRRKLSSPSFWSKLFVSKPKAVKSVESNASVPLVVAQPVEVSVSSDDGAVASDYDVEKKSAFSKVWGWVVNSPPEKHDAAPLETSSALVENELVGDMRTLAKISIATFRKLPAHKIREFKQSNDFLEFKGILRKHGLSKE